MKIVAGVAWAVCAFLACEGLALAGLSEIGTRGFSEPVIGGGSAPIMLAKKKKKKKKKKGDEDAGGGGAVHIDPNTAKLRELMVLPLVDEPTANAIIAHRPYKTAEDISKVPEVGPAKYRIFKHLIEVRQPEGATEGPAPAGGAAGGEKVEAAP